MANPKDVYSAGLEIELIELDELKAENASLKAENDELFRKAYFTIKLPRWLRRLYTR